MNTKQHLIHVPDTRKVGIYAIHNKINNKYYIGSSSNINARMKSHRSCMENMGGPNSKFNIDLQSEDDIKKFEFLVLETFEDYQITEFELRKKEEEYINKYNAYNGYNGTNRSPMINKYFNGNQYLFCERSPWKKQKKISAQYIQSLGNTELLHLYSNIILDTEERREDIKIVEMEIVERMNR